MAGVVVADHCAIVVAFSCADVLVLAVFSDAAGCAGHHLGRLQGVLGATHYDALVVRDRDAAQWDVAVVGDYVLPIHIAPCQDVGAGCSVCVLAVG